MPTINFPSSPTLNDIHTQNNKSWQWNGTSWVALGSSVPEPDVTGPALLYASLLGGW